MDQDDIPNDRSFGAIFAYGIAAAFLLYFGFFAAVLLDEVVFRTNWISGTVRQVFPQLDDSISNAIRVIYAPLIRIAKHLGAIR